MAEYSHDGTAVELLLTRTTGERREDKITRMVVFVLGYVCTVACTVVAFHVNTQVNTLYCVVCM